MCPPRPWCRALSTALLGSLLFIVIPSPSAAGPLRLPPYVAPVGAPVVDPFRPPSSPYGPGNRGIEYATVRGSPVRAAGEGSVVFAGSVARGLHVTISHPDGIRTSYSFLTRLTVTRGQRVRQGDVVGIAGPRLHVGARRGDTYIDPASLWGSAGPPRLELVPLDGGGGPTIDGRARQLRAWARLW